MRTPRTESAYEQWETVDEARVFAMGLEQELNTCKRALEKIRDLDYRGNRHESHFIAKKALE